MARSFRLFPVSLRRRTAVTAAVSVLLILTAALTLVWQATGRGGNRNATVVTVSQDAASQTSVIGTGLNLLQLPAGNLISKGTFSPDLSHAHYFADGGSQAEFLIKMSESRLRLPMTEDFMAGASMRLFRETQEDMTLLHSGRITGYEPGRVSGKRTIELPSSLEGIRWNGVAEFQGTTYLCGSAGTLLKILADGSSELIPFRFSVDLTALAAGPGGLMAGDAAGRLYVSRDGMIWSLLTALPSGRAVRTVEYIDLPDYENGFFLVSGGPGELYFGHISGLEPLDFPLDERVTALVRTGDGLIYALGDGGRAARSSNGIQWMEEPLLFSEEGWLAADAQGGLTLFAGEDGRIFVRPDQGAITALDTGALKTALGHLPADLSGVMVMSSSKLVVITSGGRLLYSSDGGVSWSRETPFGEFGIDRLKILPSGDIILAGQDGRLIRAELTARIEFSPAIPEDQVMAGDLMAVELSSSPELDTRTLSEPLREEAPAAGQWVISGGASFSLAADANAGLIGQDSGGGAALTIAKEAGTVRKDRLFALETGSVLPLTANNPGRTYLDARISQKLDLSRLLQNDKLPFYRLEFDVRFEGELDGPLEVWLAGSLSGTDASVTLHGDSWQHRRMTLILPRGLRMDDEIWLNIGFAGEGTLYLDNIWLGRGDDAPGALSSLLQTEELAIRADAVRLEASAIGRAGRMSESWSLPEAPGIHNLGAALQWTEKAQAAPWLVIDLHATAGELAHLMEYLAGSPLSDYGRLRSRDGAIGRWSDVFNLIYIEVSDLDDVLPNDASRANYVQWIMDQIKNAPDFAAVRSKIFFIDGMRYDDGRRHTSADYHAGDFRPADQPTDRQILDANTQEWVNSIPRGQMAGGLIIPELARSLSFGEFLGELRLADAAATAFDDLGDNSALILYDLDLTDPAVLSGKHVLMRSLHAAGGLSGLQRLSEPQLIRQGAEEGDRLQSIVFYAFGSRDSLVFYAVNLGTSPHVVSIQGLDRELGSSYELMDYRGNVISEGTWKRHRDDFTLLPGGGLVIRQSGTAGR